jgi:hypothetical protein
VREALQLLGARRANGSDRWDAQGHALAVQRGIARVLHRRSIAAEDDAIAGNGGGNGDDVKQPASRSLHIMPMFSESKLGASGKRNEIPRGSSDTSQLFCDL